ncbi:MAG: hypothetical protein DRH37_02460 [Deltaproteobacteria bacterium]|nr:MAG: hypothetical protein B5M55_04190 [Desulfococcus sp. 4484_242]RLC31692.1 MAG: hypothetical protein DRH37_02460 [Deltaproteobacteria bacterium]
MSQKTGLTPDGGTENGTEEALWYARNPLSRAQKERLVGTLPGKTDEIHADRPGPRWCRLQTLKPPDRRRRRRPQIVRPPKKGLMPKVLIYT